MKGKSSAQMLSQTTSPVGKAFVGKADPVSTAAAATAAAVEGHRLQRSWTLWAHLPHNNDWTLASYVPVHTMRTAEEAIALIETLPASLIENCMLFLMQEGINPMWEDPLNRTGGCFSYKILNKSVAKVWRELSYVVMGETVSRTASFVRCVNGITISPKKNFCIVKIWMSNCENQSPQVVTTDIANLSPMGCLFKKHEPEF